VKVRGATDTAQTIEGEPAGPRVINVHLKATNGFAVLAQGRS
jgi:hypothetical protein